MSSLTAFAPTAAALKARPTTTRRSSGVVVVRAEAPKDAHQAPVINTRRALLGGAVSAAMTMALTPGRADAKDGKNGVYWIAPKDGATVPKSFTVKMGVVGYEVRHLGDDEDSFVAVEFIPNHILPSSVQLHACVADKK